MHCVNLCDDNDEVVAISTLQGGLVLTTPGVAHVLWGKYI